MLLDALSNVDPMLSQSDAFSEPRSLAVALFSASCCELTAPMSRLHSVLRVEVHEASDAASTAVITNAHPSSIAIGLFSPPLARSAARLAHGRGAPPP